MANRHHKTPDTDTGFFLDITSEVCPLTFVRTKLLIERMAPGETAGVLLRGAEPLANVPRAVTGLGHIVLELVPVVPSQTGTDAVYRLRFRKATTVDGGRSSAARGA